MENKQQFFFKKNIKAHGREAAKNVNQSKNIEYNKNQIRTNSNICTG
jgi:hypothetical protein